MFIGLFISRLLLAYYIDNQKADHDQGVREKQVLSQILEGLVSLITIIIQRYKQDLTKFLGSLGESTRHSAIETIITQRYKQDLTKFLGSLGESTRHSAIETIITQRYKQDLTKFLGSLGEATHHLTIVMHQSFVTSSPSPGVTDNNNNTEI